MIRTVSKTYPIRNVPLSTAEMSSAVPEQKMLRKQRFQRGQKPYPGRLSATLRFTIRYSVNIASESTSRVMLTSESGSIPPGIETLIYHLMDLFISYLTPYNHAEWNLAFRKFSALSYVKEILVDNKHLKQPPSL